MNGKFNSSDEIGIDPTTIEVIDTLDLDAPTEVTPAQAKKNKGKDLLTKILFTFGVLVLMGGVSFGIYFYLDLGSKKAKEKEASFKLDSKEVFVGQELSSSVFDYGDFAKVDVSGCTLDLSRVDTSVAGEYPYSMICDGAKYSAKITVIEKADFIVKTNVVYKSSLDTLNVNDFIEAKGKNYVYSFANQDEALNNLTEPGGPYIVDINVTDEKGKEGKIPTYLYVTSTNVANYLKCTSKETSTDNGFSYTISDVMVFDTLRNNLNAPLRLYNFEKLDEDTYFRYLLEIKDGKLNIDNVEGYVIRDDTNHILRLLVDVDNFIIEGDLGESLPNSYSAIKELYEEKGYTCSNKM